VAAVAELLGVLGLDSREIDADDAGDDDAEIDALVRERDDARATRDFARGDAIRDELAARGIKLEDTPGGTIWRR
jgi:cysteinyl-tRNA synthetase